MSIYFTYGRREVDGKWNHPVGHLPSLSTYNIEYMANYYGSMPDGNSLDMIAHFDPTEISKEMYDAALAAQPAPSGSIS